MRPPSIPGGSWSYDVHYSFGRLANDGLVPQAGVISAGNTVLFGTTVAGGSKSVGAVFQLTHTGGIWKETALLTDNNFMVGGAHPLGLLLLHSGALYGTTNGGGAGSGGTVFKVAR
jgi:hypothetical protein